ncbi:MAG TPA: 2-dehydro-3-deoxy-D-gluconate 5-dehydrogenase KduD [Gemmatimonadaceae bacterium]|nr:2-dehydro-3-deoxy-D-gluconate 5-dehydrogenase KduD [Gemmatimonadaceae bacterium]
MNDLFSLEGRRALVTGSSRGLGRGVALALAGAGADVVCADRGATGGEETAVEIRALGRTAWSVSADLSTREAVLAMADEVERVAGPIDILVNNAGMIYRQPAAEHALESWDAVVRVNMDAVFELCQRFGRGMIARGQGKIINVASLLSFQGGINVPGYTASKHAVAGITKALANEWARHGVTVNAIAPGYMATDNTQALREDENRSREILGRIPAGRWGTPEDLGGAAVFLASRAGDYVNGHVLVVDGGWLAR